MGPDPIYSPNLFQSITSQQHTGFSVYSAVPINGDDSNARLFLSRYLKKPTISNKRIKLDETGIVPTIVITNKDGDTR